METFSKKIKGGKGPSIKLWTCGKHTQGGGGGSFKSPPQATPSNLYLSLKKIMAFGKGFGYS